MNLLAPTFAFRFSIPCRPARNGSLAAAEALDESYRIPSFSDLEGRKPFAELRMGWHADGLLVHLRVTGKTQSLSCRATRIEDSDGLQLWIDTRDTHDLHRATRFCHRFGFLPAGGGRRLDEPVAALLAISRARESPKSIEREALEVRAARETAGYRLWAFIPSSSLTGYDASEYRKLGFFFAVVDRELGWQTLTLGPEMPIDEDPSLWGSLELVAQASSS